MDKRKEKYINYVVNHLVKKTEITDRYIIFPHNHNKNYLPIHSASPLYGNDFVEYIKDTYGANTMREVETIYNLYRERIQSLINNE